MEQLQTLVEGLRNSSEKHAYQCLQQLVQESSLSDAVYSFFDAFVQMLDSPNSYIRTRGIVLIAANAKWDADYKIDAILGIYLKHITDDKPITARQCIKTLPALAADKPDLKCEIEAALHRANVLRYPESMQGLVAKDIQAALQAIHALYSC